jgi:hypothetical protein
MVATAGRTESLLTAMPRCERKCLFGKSGVRGASLPAWNGLGIATASYRSVCRARGQGYEVRYTAKKTGKSASAVKKAVKKVGTSRKKVMKRLSK